MKSGSTISVLALAAAFSGPAAAQDGLAATIAARSHFFGVGNVDQRTGAVDKEKVIISYFSVQSFAVAARRYHETASASFFLTPLPAASIRAIERIAGATPRRAAWV